MSVRLFTIFCMVCSVAALLSLAYSCNSKLDVQTMQHLANGQKLYTSHCQNCHGASGEGLGKLYPPLANNDRITSQSDQLACIIKNGQSGETVVNGTTYNQVMPPNPTLTDTDIAYILTYVTIQFGGNTETITADDVKNSLKSCK